VVPVAVAVAEILQPVVVVVLVVRAAPEQLLQDLLRKQVARVGREDHQAFLELLLFMLLVEAVELMAQLKLRMVQQRLLLDLRA
jgi:hypothetical protein